jgi:predicted anti-sigma-YlaC factor YlaD
MRRILLVALLVSLPGCSIRKSAYRTIGQALSGVADEMSRDNDPETVKGAIPFSLKALETILREDPKNASILLSLTKGYPQYAYGFVLQDAEMAEERDRAAAKEQRDRAVKLFLKGRDYGLRWFELKYPNFTADLKGNPKKAAQKVQKADLPAAYWTAVSWAAALATSRDFGMLPQIPQFEALLDRSLEVDETYDSGALHAFFITYEMARLNAKSDRAARAQQHYNRALQLAAGKQAGPHVSYAESVLQPAKNRAEFDRVLREALKVDINADPESRLLNVIMQKRARWLLSRLDKLFPPAK